MENSEKEIVPTADDLPEKVRDFMRLHGIRNLEELLEYGLPDLSEMEGFDKDCLRQLQEFLLQNRLLYRLNQFHKK